MIKQSAPSGESGDEGVSSQENLRKKKRKDSKILPHQLHSIPLRSSEFLITTRHGESSTLLEDELMAPRTMDLKNAQIPWLICPSLQFSLAVFSLSSVSSFAQTTSPMILPH
jgi:hypothetical protein